MKKIVIAALFVFCFLILFVGLGLNHGFQKRAIEEVKLELAEHFKNKGEEIISFSEADYSLEMIEIGVKTNKQSYYVVTGVVNSPWVVYTGLNLLIRPRIEIISIDVTET